MKQLKLFTGNIPPSASLKKRLKRKLQKAADRSQRDLWQQPKEEEKEMALFFLDIRDFTPFVESHVAADVIYVVRKLFSNFQNIIRINHGQIIETSGDGFYAAFGFDRDIKEAANASVRAGHSIIENLKMLNARSFTKNLNRSIEIGIGIHAGKVATGTIKLAGKDHLIVMGYPVNIASRLEASTKELNNNFIISDTVYDLLEKPQSSVSSIELLLKGVTTPIKIHLMGAPYSVEAANNLLCPPLL